jgi:hypothetical protein
MAEIKQVDLPNGGCIKYRLPNVIEQLRFHGQSGWHSPECQADVWLRTSRAVEHIKGFVVEVQGLISDIDELLNDRDNINAFISLAWDIAGGKLFEETKKP